MIIAGMASIPRRHRAVVHAARSLAPQVHTLHVCLNEYGAVPEELAAIPNVVVHRSQDDRDRGDANKFSWFWRNPSFKGYCLTADDDLIYPGDYVRNILNGVERFYRRRVVSYHGREFVRFPVRSYYKGPMRAYRCLGALGEDTAVHCPGTGVMAWHTSTIQLEQDDFRLANMADLWMGLRCQQEKVGVVCLAHRAHWIKPVAANVAFDSESIFRRHRDDDRTQTQIVNAHGTWVLHDDYSDCASF